MHVISKLVDITVVRVLLTTGPRESQGLSLSVGLGLYGPMCS
jgi:hypothetical protein